MSFYGKEYTLVKEENFDNCLRSAGVPEERIAVLSAHKGTQKIIQNGDGTYTFTFSLPQGHKEYIFTSGIEVEDRTKPSDVTKFTYTIDGNTVTEIVRSERPTMTFKKEFKGDELFETVTSNNWDGVAHRYYKA